MRKTILILIGIFVMYLICFNSIEQSDFYGTFLMTQKDGYKDSIVINSGGSYYHSSYDRKGKIMSQFGYWRIATYIHEDDVYIELNGFQDGIENSRSSYLVRLKRSIITKQIAFDECQSGSMCGHIKVSNDF
jgi:hypothetical protein